MRILLLTQFYPPVLGGEERHAHTLAGALTRRGHAVEVVTTATGSTGVSDRIEDGVIVHRVRSSAQQLHGLHSDPNRPHALPIPDPAMRAAIARLLEGERFDVVHAHNWIVNSALGPARSTDTPLVLTLHDYSHVCAVKRYLRDGMQCSGPTPVHCLGCAAQHYGAPIGVGTALANNFARRARNRGVTAFVAVSRAVAEHNRLAAAGVRFRVIPNLIPDELVGERAEPSPDAPLLFLGDLTEDKGVPMLLEAYRCLEAPPKLLLVGRRDLRLTLDLPDGASVLPPCNHEEAMLLIRAARAVLVPSIVADACPTVVLEAMAAGRPVVATPRGGIVDLVTEGVTGLLAEPEPKAFADAMATLLENRARAEEMGHSALRSSLRYTASSVAGQLEELYAEVATGFSEIGHQTP